MSKRLLKLLAFMLALVFTLSGCSLFKINKEVDDQTVVAEFDGGQILKGEAMQQYAEVEAYYQSYGQTLTDAQTILSIKQELLNMMCEEAVVRAKAEAQGLTTLTDDERADLTAEATASFNEAVEYYMVYFDEGSEDESRQAAVDFMAEQGFTLESEIEYAIENAWQDKMYNEVTKDVVASEEEIQAAYDDMVAADQETYGNSPYDFEYAVTSGEPVAWVPEGYRTVKHILIPFTDDQVVQLDDLIIELEDVRYQLEGETEEGDLPPDEHDEGDGHTHDDELLIEADGAADIVADPEPDDLPDEDFGEDEEPVLTHDELVAKEAELSRRLDALKAEFAATLQDKVDEINQKILAGADFDQLIEEYGEDYGMQVEPSKSEGYYVCEGSEMWEEEFTRAAMALSAVGDVSEPVIGSSGIHIIRYNSDVTAGPVPLDQLREAILDVALTDAKDAHYEATIEQWMNEANVKTYVDRMK